MKLHLKKLQALKPGKLKKFDLEKLENEPTNTAYKTEVMIRTHAGASFEGAGGAVAPPPPPRKKKKRKKERKKREKEKKGKKKKERKKGTMNNV